MRHLLAAALLIAVAQAGAEELSTVFVYAQRETPARSWKTVLCDNAPAADLKRGYFFALDVPAGRHVISMPDAVPVTVEARPGARIYIRLDWHYELNRPPVPVFGRVHEQVGADQLRHATYIPRKRARSPAVPLRDPRHADVPQLKTR